MTMPEVNQEKNGKGQTINVVEHDQKGTNKLDLEGELVIRGRFDPVIYLNTISLNKLIAKKFTTGDQVKVIVIKRS